MVVPAVPHGAARGADGEPAAVELVARAIPKLCSLVHDLDERQSPGAGRRERGMERGVLSTTQYQCLDNTPLTLLAYSMVQYNTKSERKSRSTPSAFHLKIREAGQHCTAIKRMNRPELATDLSP